MTALADRLAALSITPEEAAAVCRVPVEEMDRWVRAESLGGEAAVSLRWLADDHVAALAVDRVRTLRTLPLRGEGMAAAGIEHTPAAPVQTGGSQ